MRVARGGDQWVNIFNVAVILSLVFSCIIATIYAKSEIITLLLKDEQGRALRRGAGRGRARLIIKIKQQVAEFKVTSGGSRNQRFSNSMTSLWSMWHRRLLEQKKHCRRPFKPQEFVCAKIGIVPT